MKREVAEQFNIDRDVKITLLSVLQKGYFEQKDINFLKEKIEPLKNQATNVFFRRYGKANEHPEEDFVNEEDE